MRYLMAAAAMVIVGIVMFETGKLKGTQQGYRQALKTNPVSEELEMTCAGLWVTEQNKKAIDKEALR